MSAYDPSIFPETFSQIDASGYALGVVTSCNNNLCGHHQWYDFSDLNPQQTHGEFVDSATCPKCGRDAWAFIVPWRDILDTNIEDKQATIDRMKGFYTEHPKGGSPNPHTLYRRSQRAQGVWTFPGQSETKVRLHRLDWGINRQVDERYIDSRCARFGAMPPGDQIYAALPPSMKPQPDSATPRVSDEGVQYFWTVGAKTIGPYTSLASCMEDQASWAGDGTVNFRFEKVIEPHRATDHVQERLRRAEIERFECQLGIGTKLFHLETLWGKAILYVLVDPLLKRQEAWETMASDHQILSAITAAGDIVSAVVTQERALELSFETGETLLIPSRDKFTDDWNPYGWALFTPQDWIIAGRDEIHASDIFPAFHSHEFGDATL